MLRTQNDTPFSHCTTVKDALSHRLVIAKVRVSGGHLCEAEAPTEPASETQSDCGNPFFPFKVLRILSCSALRMTNRFVIASTNRCAAIRSFPLRHCDRRKACSNPFSPFRVLRILSCSALRKTNRFVIANAVRQAAIFLLLFLTRNFLFNH